MRKQAVALSVIVAALTSVITSAFWAEVTPATAGGVHNIYKVVTGINYKGVVGDSVTASPGDVQHGDAGCPTTAGWHLISGGYIESGIDAHRGLPESAE